jgi:DNA repair exonuclease SbcCD ATPase subunit
MLTKLTLENFKRHKNLTVDLSEGLNLITGPNFTGKSSILQAIRYAFEGATAVPGGKAVITRRGEKKHKVELEVTLDGSDYVITRTTSGATLKRDGEVIAKSTSAVTNHLTELLGMTGQRFSQLRYGKQKETEALLTLGAAELHKIVGEVSQVEIINDVIAKCSAAVSECNGGIKVLPDVDLTAKKQAVEETKGALEKIHALLQSLVGQIDDVNDQIGMMEGTLRQMTAANAVVSTANTERTRLSLDMEKLTSGAVNARTKVDSLVGADVRHDSLRTEHAQLHDGIAKATAAARELATLTKQRDGLIPRLKASKEECDRMQHVLYKHHTDFDLAPQQVLIDNHKKILTLTKKELAESRTAAASGVCPSCKRPYEGHGEGWLQALDVKITELCDTEGRETNTLQKLESDLASWVLSNESLEKLRLRVSSLEDTEFQQRADVKKLNEQIDPLSALDPDEALHSLQIDFGESEEKVNRASAEAMELNSAQTELAGLDKRLDEVMTKQRELGPMEEVSDLSDENEELDGYRKMAKGLNDKYTPQAAKYTQLTGSLATMEAELAAGEEQAIKRKTLASRLTVANQLGLYLRKNRDRFMAHVWGGIMGQASNFTTACTGGAIEQVGRGDDGKFTYVEEGHEMPVTAASGAQRSIMGLGVQLAMAQMLPSPLSTLMLDEPGADMDAERSLSLTTLLAADNHQLLMISHREMDGAVADNTISLEP